MKIIKIQLDGFGKLIDRNFQFASGINLVFGPNEVGKSTLQQAILALLYGFFDEGRITKALRTVHDSLIPWDEKVSYGGSIIYSLENGEEFKVVRRFYPEYETFILSLPGEDDISAQFARTDRGRLFFADKQLGMSKVVFENTCYVRQADLIALDSSASAITETLMRLSSSASTDTTANDAINILETTLRDEVGSQRAYTKPFAKAIKLLSKLEIEREHLIQKRREVFSLFKELNQCQELLKELEVEKDQIIYKQVLADYEETKSNQKTIDDIASEIDDLADERKKWKNWAEFPVNLRDDVLRLNVNRKHHQDECRKREQIASEAAKKLREIDDAIRTQEELIGEFEDARGVSREELSSIHDLKSRVEIAANYVQSCQNRLNSSTEALNEESNRVQVDQPLLDKRVTISKLAEMEQQLISAQESVNRAKANLGKARSEWQQVGMSQRKYLELERFVQEIDSGIRPAPKPRKGCRSMLKGIMGKNEQPADQTPKEVIIYRQIKPIYTHYHQVHGEYESSNAALATLETEIKNSLGDQTSDPLEPTIFPELRAKLEKSMEFQASLRQQQKTVTQLQSELEQASERYDQVKKTLKTKLSSLGYDTTDLKSAIQDFEAQCDRKTDLEKVEMKLERYNAQADKYKREISAWEAAKGTLEDVEVELRNLLCEAVIDCEDISLEQAISEYELGVKKYQEWEKVQSAYGQALKRQQMLLEGKDQDQLQKTSNKLLEKLKTIQNEHSNWVGLRPEKSYRDYALDIQQINRKEDEFQKDQLRLQDTIQHISTSLRSLAEIDEQIYEVRLKINSLEQFRDELELARDSLSQAIQEFQKQFAPRIELLMSEGISRSTQKRYSFVKVDPKNLDVSLVAPELGKKVGVNRLSTGTQDMVYLMLRIAIARYMSSTGEKLPLLLDDPLVQFDPQRLQEALYYLLQLSEDIQILIFSKDPVIKYWSEKNQNENSGFIDLI